VHPLPGPAQPGLAGAQDRSGDVDGEQTPEFVGRYGVESSGPTRHARIVDEVRDRTEGPCSLLEQGHDIVFMGNIATDGQGSAARPLDSPYDVGRSGFVANIVDDDGVAPCARKPRDGLTDAPTGARDDRTGPLDTVSVVLISRPSQTVVVRRFLPSDVDNIDPLEACVLPPRNAVRLSGRICLRYARMASSSALGTGRIIRFDWCTVRRTVIIPCRCTMLRRDADGSFNRGRQGPPPVQRRD